MWQVNGRELSKSMPETHAIHWNRKLSKVYNLDKLEIVTFDDESTLQENGVTIRIIPVWKWLLKI
jgi:predicted AAA+ superfamily ATPase